MTTAPVPCRELLKWEKIARVLRARIAEMPAHTPLPSERNMIAEFRVARPTIRRALAELEREGIIVTYPYRGSFSSP